MNIVRKYSDFLLLAALLFFSTVALSQSFKEDDNIELLDKKILSAINLVDMGYVDDVDRDGLIEDAIVGMLKKLDPHSVYYSAEEIKKVNEPLVGNFDGIGIQFDIVKDSIMVVSPIAGGPSEKLGIMPGDRIVKIEDENVAGIGVKNQDVINRLRGKKGTKVTISIFRRGTKKLLDFTIVRDKIPIYSIDAHYMATPKTGYIKLNRFSRPTMDEFKSSMQDLQSQGMENLILDLRGNSGGYLNVAVDLADEFLKDNKMIVYSEGRSYPRKDQKSTSRGSFEEGKLIVLVDGGSASASEIVSGAVQDWDRGLVIGRRTFGKGLVQKSYSLPDGAAIRLTVARYYTPAGRSIQRPYEEGVDKYYDELSSRMEKGELMFADSIKFPDSLKFYTANNRLVYGGGGIMPDIFVPVDTTKNSDYWIDLNRHGVFYKFARAYLDENRSDLMENYQNIADFKKNFKVDTKLLKKFRDFAKDEGVKHDEDGFNKSEDFVLTSIRAHIARNLWNTSAFYQIQNEISDIYVKALEALEDNDSFSLLHKKTK